MYLQPQEMDNNQMTHKSWTIKRSYSQESDDLNPDYLELTRLKSPRNLNIELNSNFSNILLQINKRETAPYIVCTNRSAGG